MRETATAFVHARDVESPIARHVTGDLRVADEGTAVDHCYRWAPCGAIVGGEGFDQGTPTNVKVVSGDVHSPEERRGWIVVGPARFAVVAAIVMNTEMGPAVWIVRSRRLVSAQGAAPIRINPHRKPRAGRLVVQSNRIAKGVGKRAAPAAIGHPGEGQSAIGGN